MKDLTATLEKNLGEMFGIKDVQKRLKARAEEEAMAAQQAAPAPQQSQTAPEWIPIDIYRNNSRKQLANSRKEFPKGSRAIVNAIAKMVIEGDGGSEGLWCAKKKAEDDSAAS